jgi:hypothetical protein
MVAELVEGILRVKTGFDRGSYFEPFCALVLSVFDRYEVPAALGEQRWSRARDDLAHRLAQIGLHPPKRAMDIPEQFARAYFDLMPIHEKLRARDFPTTRNYLRVTLVNLHDELSKRLDSHSVVNSLRDPGD